MSNISNLIAISVLTLVMIILIMYIFFTNKACSFRNLEKVSKYMMLGGYILYFITVLYTLVKSIYYGHITINNITLVILVISCLISLLGILVNKLKNKN